MTAALDGAQRTALSNLIQKARSLLEMDLASALEGTFGIHHGDGWIEEADALSLDASQAAVRTDLLDIVAYLRSEGETQLAAVERLIREAAFTHVNRLVALRVAEGLGYLPEAIGKGLASQGFRDFAEIAPASADEQWERFRLFVRICADELSADVPALFDPRNPLLELEPSAASFSVLIGLFVAADETIWSAPDTLGWSYQFFNSAEERREMRESSAPRNSRELAVRNQFFTPSYVVEFLVQNGLGAHLAASYPALVDELPLLVEVPEPAAKPIDLREVSALDPACGSGHFLLGAYDVLEAAWRLAGVQPEDAAPDIVRSLWGIDIDPRATQIAQAAVIFRARRHCRAPLPKPNVICARSLPAGPEVDALIATLPPRAGRVVRAITNELVMAPVLGPLLKVEERLDRDARDAFGTGQIEGTLSEGLPEDDTANVESLVLETLAAIADQTASTASQRLFAAEAHDAVRFVEAMNRRYTAVLMNPPFGEPVPSTKDYLKAAYPWIPARTRDLLTAFVGRGVELSDDGHGTCGAITSRAGLFLSTFENWRKEVLLDRTLTTVADLGYGVMDQALVEAAAYVVRNRSSTGSARILRLLKATDRPEAIGALSAASRAEREHPDVFDVRLADLMKVPRAPLAYWIPDEVRELFDRFPALGDFTDVRQGLATGDDFRYVRAFWEVSPNRVAASLEATEAGMRWVAFAKGGEYSPNWSHPDLLVDWEDHGDKIRGDPAARPQNTQFYFKPGLTWTRRTASAFAARFLPEGCIFSDKGNIVFGDQAVGCMPWLNSRLGAALLALQMPAADETTSGGASKSYEVGTVARIPVPQALPPLLENHARRAVELRRRQDLTNELSTDFVAPQLRLDPLDYSIEFQLIDLSLDAERIALDAVGAASRIRQFLDEEIGFHPGELPLIDDNADLIAELFVMPIQDLISRLISERGGSRSIASLSYIADRRLEVIAQGCGVNPRVIASVAADRGLEPPGRTIKFAQRYVSYLVGCAFGRWELAREGVTQIAGSPDAMGTVLTAWASSASRNAPQIFVDQPGHEFDFVAAVTRMAEALPSDAFSLERVVQMLQTSSSLHRYLRGGFFADHLSYYTSSRRKAPIYWQLQVPSKKWGVWLYLPRLSREMLFAVVRETEQRQRLAEQRIATLRREYDQGGAGRTIAAVSKELDAEQKLAVELVTFRDEADRIANLGWEPDLDDGAVLNAAPLALLFPAWKDAAKYRQELQQGKHTWSTVSKYADQL